MADQKTLETASQLSDPEKDTSHVSDRLADFEDPDAGLSDEERAQIV
jgi:hypothetical protein